MLAGILTTGLAVGGSLLTVAWKADEANSPAFNRGLSLRLVGLDPVVIGRAVRRWPLHFAALIDAVFGKKHLCWHCYSRSSIVSLLAFLVCTFVFVQVPNDNWNDFIDGGAPLEQILLLSVLVAVLNLLPGYISLLETRWAIQRMQSPSSLAGYLG